MTSPLQSLLRAAAVLATCAFGVAGVSAQSITVGGCTSFTTSAQTNTSNIQITCNTGGGGGPTAPSCYGASISEVGSPATSLTLRATCAQGTSAITGVTANGTQMPGPFNSPYSVNLAGIAVPTVTTTYSVTATDGSLNGSASVQYVVGGGGSIDLSACAAQGFTGRGVTVTSWPTSSGNINIAQLAGAAASPKGTFGNNDALVIRFTTPASDGTTHVWQPAGDPPNQSVTRVSSVATQPCQIPTQSGASGSIIATGGTYYAFDVGSCKKTGFGSGCANTVLQPNTTYYVTMINRTSIGGVGSCPVSSCEMHLNFNY